MPENLPHNFYFDQIIFEWELTWHQLQVFPYYRGQQSNIVTKSILAIVVGYNTSITPQYHSADTGTLVA